MGDKFRIYSSDKINKNRIVKEFIVCKPKAIYNIIKRGEKVNLYENFIDTNKIKLHIDVDIKEKYFKPNEDPEVTFQNYIDEILEVTNDALYRHYNIEDPQIIIIKSETIKDKLSAHIIYPKIIFENIQHIKQFFMDLDSPLLENGILDTNIYRTGCFRLLWCSKLNKKNKLEYYKGINYNHTKKKKLFNDCLLLHIKDNLKVLKYAPRHKTSIKKKTKAPSINNTYKIEKHYNDVDIRLKKYLDILSPRRAEDYEDWFVIGAIIFNEGGTFKLFNDFSAHASNYNHEACKDMWTGTYEEDRNKKATYKKLCEFCKIDNKDKYYKIVRGDVTYNMDCIFKDGPTDRYMINLYYSLAPSQYMYDDINNLLYKFNKYGIYGKLGATKGEIKINISDTLEDVFSSEFNRRYVELNNNVLKSSKDEELKSIYKKNKTKEAKLVKTYNKIKKYIRSYKNIKLISEGVCDLYTITDIAKKLDKAKNIIPFLNGVYDLNSFTFRTGRRDEYITKTTLYNYKPVSENYKDKMNSILDPIFNDKEEQKYVLKSLASSLNGKNIEEEFYMWIGSSRNGKGMIDKLLQTTFGDKYATLDINYFMQPKYDPNAPNSALAMAKDALIVMVNEPPQGAKLNETILKKMTGGDTLITRDMYEKAQKFIPMFKLFFLTNNNIEINGEDQGIKRRFRLINFRNVFINNPKLPNQKLKDDTLKTKIGKDRNYALAFFDTLITHYKLYLREGLKQPSKMEKETTEYVEDYDPIQQFINERVILTENPKDFISSTDLFREYKDYMEDELKKINSRNFKRAMLQKGIQLKRKNNKRGYSNLKLKIIEDDENEY